MPARFYPLLTLVFFITHGVLTAQPVPSIHLKKDLSRIYFFQKGSKSDTIQKNKNDLFYLLVPDSLKDRISVIVENGRLQPAANDSLVTLELLKGLSYESLYSAAPEHQVSPLSSQQQRRYLRSFINGTSAAEPGNTIRIRIWNVKEEKTVLENVFYYKD